MAKIMVIERKECYEILKKYLRRNDKKKLDKNLEHARNVLLVSEKIIIKLDGNIKFSDDEKELIYRSAIFHDIAKNEDEDDHHKIACEILKKEFDDDDDLNKICKIIECHKGKFNPKEDIAKHAAILRMADKIDKFRKARKKKNKAKAKKKMREAEEKYDGSLNKIKEYFEEIIKCNDFYGNFKEGCEAVCSEEIDHTAYR